MLKLTYICLIWLHALIRFNTSRSDNDHGSWPGFVDALSTVLLVFIFVLVGFIASQMYLSQMVIEKDSDLSSLERELNSANAFIANTNDKNVYLENQVKDLKNTIDKLTAMISDEKNNTKKAQESLNEANNKSASLADNIKALTEYTEQLKNELQQINKSLASQKAANEEQSKTIEYMQNENLKLSEIQKLNEYRSDFFAKLCNILKGNPNIKIAGDRFMFQSELLFDSASAQLTDNGVKQIAEVANVVKAISSQIPKDVPWILCVNGHTDMRYISNSKFPSNWHLAFARAMAVVELLIRNGVPANRLAVVSFGAHQPVSRGSTPAHHAQNRRIEFKIDSNQLTMPNNAAGINRNHVAQNMNRDVNGGLRHSSTDISNNNNIVVQQM